MTDEPSRPVEFALATVAGWIRSNGDHVRSLAVTFDLSVTSEADRRIVGNVGRRPPCHFSMQN
ncbi:MAG: hypothetical protein ACRDG9_09350 [Actinomycetota bacterium]